MLAQFNTVIDFFYLSIGLRAIVDLCKFFNKFDIILFNLELKNFI